MTLDRYRTIVPDWEGFLAAARRPEPTVLRVRSGRMSPAELEARLGAQGFRLRALPGMPGFFQVEEQPFPVSFTFEHWVGACYVQQASTGVAAPALGPRPGERVLDLCAAPGGKTTHAAELMGDRGCLVAADVSESRIRGLLGNVYRLGHTHVVTVAGDGRDFPGGAFFDRVLVDAPCTGEGTLRRRSGKPPRQSKSFLGYVTRAQEALLRRAVALTRPGGTVLYVTCTFAPEENEAVVDAVLRDAPVELEPLALPVPHAPGITTWEGTRYDPRVEGAARIYPHHLDSGGLFLARLRKVGEAGASRERVGGDANMLRAIDGSPTEPPAAAQPGWSPVPPVFPGDGATPEEAERRLQAGLAMLRDRFGVSGVGNGVDPDAVGWTLRGGRLWMHTAAAWPLEAWAPGSWRPVSVGLRAVEFDSRERPRPTNDLLRWLGGRIAAGTLDLSDTELQTLLAGRTLPPRPDLRGPLALRWRGEVLGRGVPLPDGVRSEIPKARRRELARARARAAVVEAVDPTGAEAGEALARYYAELDDRFEGGFDPAESVLPDAAELAPPDGSFLVMRLDGRVVGCGAVKRVSPEVGYIKRMWVDGTLRGMGLGRRLLAALEDATLGLGCSVARLETHRVLAEAIRLYRKAGYVEVEPFNDEPYAHHWFEKRLDPPPTTPRTPRP